MGNRWLLKTEPGDYSFPDLVRDGETVWDGVRAPQALKNISRMQAGDLALIYHTGKERAIVGTAEITRGPYPDPKEVGPRFLVVDVRAGAPLKSPVPLKVLKEKGFSPDWDLLRLPRLSVVPVSAGQWQDIMALAEKR